MAGQAWRGKIQCTRAGGEEGKAYRKGADGVDGLLIDLAVTHFAECLRDWFYEGGKGRGREGGGGTREEKGRMTGR
jgi:hypothetical protein